MWRIVVAALAALAPIAVGCASPPGEAEPPPPGARRWDLAPFEAEERFEVRIPGVARIGVPRPTQVKPVGGYEHGEGGVGVGIDLLGISIGPDEEPARAAPGEGEVDRGLERVERRREREALERAVERVHEAAKRAGEAAPGPVESPAP